MSNLVESEEAKRELKLIFTKEGMKVQKKIRKFFGGEEKWIDDDELSYQEINVTGINGFKLTVDKIDTVIENGNLKSLILHVTDYSRNPPTPPPPPPPPTTPPPQKQGIFIQGEFIKCRFQYEILVNTANWLIAKGPLTTKGVPIKAAGRPAAMTNLINSRRENDKAPRHENGEYFSTPKELINGWWIETRYGLPSAKKNAKHLMVLCGYSESDLKVRGFEIQPRSRGE